jgi:geranylgeranyl transferase type-1 subunit beta
MAAFGALFASSLLLGRSTRSISKTRIPVPRILVHCNMPPPPPPDDDESPSLPPSSAKAFDRPRHIRYFAHSLKSLPAAYAHLDTNRLTLCHFAVHSLDLLGVLGDDDLLTALGVRKDTIVDWIYSLQMLPWSPSADDANDADDADDENKKGTSTTCSGSSETKAGGGFKGGGFLGGPGAIEYDHSHVAMTYTALCTLAALGDDLSRFDRSAIQSLKKLQLDDGSFQCIHFGSENDMRFLFCACAISHMLNDWSGVDVDKAVDFIRSCRSYDGAISLLPGQEGHGGSTFCAVSALTLMGKIEDVLAEDGWRDELIRWCVSRQLGGMQGRPNKVEDTCYSYWIGGTLRLLGCDNLLDKDALTSFVLSCQTDMGGFSKVQGVYPDLLHSFYSMAWLSLSRSQGLNDLHCALGMRLAPTNVFEQFHLQDDEKSIIGV